MSHMFCIQFSIMCSESVEIRATISENLPYYNLKECRKMLLIYKFYKRKMQLINVFQYMGSQVKGSWCSPVLPVEEASTVKREQEHLFNNQEIWVLVPMQLSINYWSETSCCLCKVYSVCTLYRRRKLS